MKNKFLNALILIAIVALPAITFAQGKTLRDVIATVIGYFSVFITLIIGLAFLTFVWNVYNYFFKADVENKKEAGLYVLYSVIGFFVILSIWGLVNILSNSLNLDNRAPSWWPFSMGGSQQSAFPTNSNNQSAFPTNSNRQSAFPTNSNNNVGSYNTNFNVDASLNEQSDIPYNPDQDPSLYYQTDIPADN